MTDDNTITQSVIIDRSVLLEPFEDWCDSELVIPRDTDRIMEQFILMLLRISAHLTKQGTDPSQLYRAYTPGLLTGNLLLGEDTDPPPSVGNDKTRTTSYLQQYPQIFMKKDTARLRSSPPTTPEDSSKNLKRNENISKCLKISEKIIDFKPTFELKEAPLQEVSEIMIDDAESINNRETRNLDTDVRSRSVGCSNEQANQTIEDTRSNDTFDDIIEKLRQSVIEKLKKNNQLDRLSLTNHSSQSSQSSFEK